MANGRADARLPRALRGGARPATSPPVRDDRGIARAGRRRHGGWTARLHDARGAAEEGFDRVVVATGQFSRPNRPDFPGAETFAATGGTILHSSEHVDGAGVRGSRVVVLGFSKSATDVAVHAVEEGAAAVTLVHRDVAWKIPYFFGGALNFKRVLYTRLAEAMFLPFDASPGRRLAQRAFAPLTWANWRALEALLTAQFGLKRTGLRPGERIEDTIHCALGVETPGFYRMVADGRIRALRGTIGQYEGGAVVTSGGERVAADLVILATGWHQELPFLGERERAALVEPDGAWRLYRNIVNPRLPSLGFVGFNSSFATTLSADLGARWLARYWDGLLVRQPMPAEMEAEIERSLTWRRSERPAAAGYGGLCIAPWHHRHFGQLLADMGARSRPANPVAAWLLPLDPAAYGRLLETAPPVRPAGAMAPTRESVPA
ncbi:NAD(P)-binding domain-containing protein [Roseomonas sp. CCTCC AB2023176]|uniref:NAD(P)-binding domain-containing protein n=1 Tax=Roseomonas sp. CCTCC AB2023176 TaxID=3342640 RepID=UPI0035DF38DF